MNGKKNLYLLRKISANSRQDRPKTFLKNENII